MRATAGGDALDGAETARAIACASLRGATASQLAARLRAEYARVPAAVRERSACVPLDAMLAEAETPRPFTLRDPCPAAASP